jgi:hypothetical protein
MPNYTYYDSKKKERFTLNMSMDEMIQFEKDNPKLERVFEPTPTIDPAGAGVSRPPSDFSKYVLGKVKAKHPKGSVEKRWTIPKEV